MNPAFDEVLAAGVDAMLSAFDTTALRLGTASQNIEKDFWVCWTLDALFNGLKEGGPRLLFKGGTSLSKGFGLINRFSEDVDVTVFRNDIGEPATIEELDALSGKKRRARLDAIKDACQAYINGPLRAELMLILQGRLRAAGIDAGAADVGAKITRTLQLWAEALLASPATTRRHLADVAGAMRRHPDPTHVAYLARMLERDQQVYSRAHDSFRADKNDKDALQEIRTLHEWAYRDALVAVGTDEAAGVLTAHLTNQYFGPQAAVGLMLIWRSKNGRDEEARFGRWPDAGAAAAQRKARENAPEAMTASTEAIFKVVGALLESGDPKDLVRAVNMAGSAVLMPHGDKSQVLDRILAGALSPSGAYDLLSRMVMRGITVRSTDLMKALSATVTRFRKAPPSPGKAVLGEIVATVNAPELFLLLAQDQTGRLVLERRLHRILDDLIHDRVSLNGSPIHSEVFRRDSSRLRAGLFSLILADDPEVSGFAARCLDIVDATRDEEGTVGTEPRHPDISTEAPWPQVAMPAEHP